MNSFMLIGKKIILVNFVFLYIFLTYMYVGIEDVIFNMKQNNVIHFFFESRNELIQKNDKHKAIATDPAPTSQENKKTKELVLS